MRLERLALGGFSAAFPNVVDLDLRDIPPGLIAVVGPNGAGKTTLLEVTPAAIFRRLPARDGADPVHYATGRESFLDLTYAIDGVGVFRSRLNLDGPKRQTDAVLETILTDGTHAPLNDGKRSTYDAAIAVRFSSFDLFINSSFAAQGRGDEFTRRKPSQRKDLFVEFLALQHYAAMAAAASGAADLIADARLRLTVRLEQLARECDQRLVDELDRLAHQLQIDGGAAECRQRELTAEIADLEQRSAVLRDQVAAYAAAQLAVRTAETELETRRGDLTRVTRQQETVRAEATREDLALAHGHDRQRAEVEGLIENNRRLLANAVQVQAAVTAVDEAQAALDRLRDLEAARRQDVEALDRADRVLQGQLTGLQRLGLELKRAEDDSALLHTVPCGGAGTYAQCQFLRNATAAEAKIPALQREYRSVEDVQAQLEANRATLAAARETLAAVTGEILTHRQTLSAHHQAAALRDKLAAADARIEELTARRDQLLQQVEAQRHGLTQRTEARLAELRTEEQTLARQVDHAAQDLDDARRRLTDTASGNAAAVSLQAELTSRRLEWDRMTAAIARVASGRQELERRRQVVGAARDRQAHLRDCVARVEQELVEWRDLAKALGKGGLPDLEIDAAGPTISALTNDLLLSCFGPRFSVELVTQVLKADGSGMKDEFTVRVFDNDAGGGWRDLAELSGGEKTIVQEALMSAIALYVNERSPLPIHTLFRDETGAALDAENAVRYVQMLRRVRERGGLHHIFFISHNPAAAALADVQIQVGDGTARLVYPPFAEAA